MTVKSDYEGPFIVPFPNHEEWSSIPPTWFHPILKRDSVSGIQTDPKPEKEYEVGVYGPETNLSGVLGAPPINTHILQSKLVWESWINMSLWRWRWKRQLMKKFQDWEVWRIGFPLDENTRTFVQATKFMNSSPNSTKKNLGLSKSMLRTLTNLLAKILFLIFISHPLPLSSSTKCPKGFVRCPLLSTMICRWVSFVAFVY